MEMTNITALVKFHEGLRLRPYQCPAGRWTWGYGRNIEDNPPRVNELLTLLDNGVTEPVAAYWLEQDLTRCIDHMFAHLATEWTVCAPNPARRAVLVDMCYNLGIMGLVKFRTTRSHICGRDFESAARSMLQSKWAKQVKGRAHRLARMMQTGEWPDDVPGIMP